MHRLFVVTPDGHIRNLELEGATVTLGRARDNVLSFPDDQGLSRHHLSFEPRDGGWSVRDLDSKNGTKVNERALDAPHELQPGDRVEASHVVLTYQVPSGGERLSWDDDSGPMKTEVTFLEDVVSKSRAGEDVAGHFLLRAARELSERRPLPELFGGLLELCLDAARAERGVLLTLDEGGGLVTQASRGGELTISTTVRDEVLGRKASVLVRDAADGESLGTSSVRRLGVCSLLAIPLQTESRVMGIVYVDSVDPARRFSRDDLDVLTAIANIGGIRIELEHWELRRRELMSENVANLGRLAASLSHELNNPLGILKSCLDTLWRTTATGGTLTDEARGKIESVQSELRKTVSASVERMQQVIARIQRFSNLDRAETRSVDIEELLEDVVALAEIPPGPVSARVECGDLPRVTCRPQPLSSALTSLMAYLFERCRDDGAESLRVAGSSEGSHIVIEMTYPGGELSAAGAAELFAPNFEIVAGRVASRGFSLFSARQVLRDQGGDVEAVFGDGRTGFRVRLPCGPDASESS